MSEEAKGQATPPTLRQRIDRFDREIGDVGGAEVTIFKTILLPRLRMIPDSEFPRVQEYGRKLVALLTEILDL
jgi:hypothetical protein